MPINTCLKSHCHSVTASSATRWDMELNFWVLIKPGALTIVFLIRSQRLNQPSQLMKMQRRICLNHPSTTAQQPLLTVSLSVIKKSANGDIFSFRTVLADWMRMNEKCTYRNPSGLGRTRLLSPFYKFRRRVTSPEICGPLCSLLQNTAVLLSNPRPQLKREETSLLERNT